MGLGLGVRVRADLVGVAGGEGEEGHVVRGHAESARVKEVGGGARFVGQVLAPVEGAAELLVRVRVRVRVRARVRVGIRLGLERGLGLGLGLRLGLGLGLGLGSGYKGRVTLLSLRANASRTSASRSCMTKGEG